MYFDTGATYDCVDADKAAVDEVSALALLDARSGYGEKLVAAMEPAGEIDGVPVVERPGCEYWFEGVCRRIFAVPSLGVVFAVTINEDSDGHYETIRDSLRRLPAEVITVPLKTADGLTPGFGAEPKTADALIRAIERAGLEVATEVAEVGESDSGSYASLPEGSLLEIEPGPGSPIATGGSVTVTLSGASTDPAQ
ncbi:PASTA domain-containing protein [Nocardioides aurantiacus]|uniref:PASTA domain-containing protein n=1 Tax=Nocardioides aurantiacus TaxID=86796 RepID=A0A3N2CTU9_9ACTN|nr:PASTA domain-containing protein [Nocardioides aurantiacus]ROR90962.1 hypothetical protein EDD33_1819 [Nocardioides aurantiacus]